MSNFIEIKLSLDISKAKNSKALSDFFSAIGGQETVSVNLNCDGVVTERIAPKSVKAEPVKAEPVEEVSSSVYTLIDLRELVKPKLALHREEVVAKLRGLGANKITDLGEKDYEVFAEFCKSL